ncbi:putative entry exclusion protein TrbK-alt [Agrobacterium tumefaciens]|uniref:putative entry exclusion protein TrbK-alt n=1 Tax=Agrobacterium tumefaciens TaxID=358 RepID=UPI001572BC36|nr:putative entry exclusion protein TrbK-alt [Agrobacterium tumefaciens]UXT20440.1 putative entry exclusion protein TrbK-alt [Agrobacterium tumefaciens]WHO20768.1 putative entry exclusion protein TrbK-alt [Agrobacterium tumefaciens]WHO23553.1 putative entry exclusion protein TrbK-alt [Agrobacterium tumefaciens]
MDGKMLARLGAVVFVAVAISAAVIEFTRKKDAPVLSPVRLRPIETDPLREAQRQCQQLGEKADKDTECLRVWAETRNRFLGRTPAPVSPISSEGR